MAKKTKTIYAPGELSKVRGKLGELNAEEAKRMAQILGGEVGYERTEEQEEARKKPRTRHETVELVVKGRKSSGRRSHRNVAELYGTDEKPNGKAAAKTGKEDVSDDPSVQLKTSYFERLKIDRYAALPEFSIKTSMQTIFSMFSFFTDPPEYLNPVFITKRMNDYYQRIEQLVTSTRTLFPRNNMKRSERIKKTSPFVYSILDTIRYWNIEKITGDLAKIQSRPRTARITEFADILRAIYKPLFIIEQLDTDIHIRGAYKLLYKVLFIENPTEAKEKYQGLIRTALSSLSYVRGEIHYLLYPLLLKLLSDRWLPYETFFTERHRRFMAFLKVTEQERIEVPAGSEQQADSGNLEAVRDDVKHEQEEASDVDEFEDPEEDPEDPKVIERKAKEAAHEVEQKALERGLATMELLFPKAGWDRLSTFPDLYPYFADTLKLKRGYELIAPTDPLQLAAVLMHIMEEFFFALRYVTFGVITGSDGNPVRVEDYLGSIINNWQRYINESFGKEYLPRLSEYCQMLEQSVDSKNSAFARRTMNELQWAKRLYYLPYYKFETIGPPPFQKRDTTPIYGEIKLLRKYLTAVAAGIEQGNRQGGAEALAPCDGIDNPWEPYNFEVPNPISMRMDMLLAHSKRNNASLIFFCLSVAVVLDHLVNDESSWAYEGRHGPLFRSVNNEGIMPLFGVETKLDADLIFKMALKQRQKEKEDK